MAGKERPCFAASCEDLHNTFRNAGLFKKRCKGQASKWCFLRRLDDLPPEIRTFEILIFGATHNHVPSGQCWKTLQNHRWNRCVERVDSSANA